MTCKNTFQCALRLERSVVANSKGGVKDAEDEEGLSSCLVLYVVGYRVRQEKFELKVDLRGD